MKNYCPKCKKFSPVYSELDTCQTTTCYQSPLALIEKPLASLIARMRAIGIDVVPKNEGHQFEELNEPWLCINGCEKSISGFDIESLRNVLAAKNLSHAVIEVSELFVGFGPTTFIIKSRSPFAFLQDRHKVNVRHKFLESVNEVIGYLEDEISKKSKVKTVRQKKSQ